MGQAALAVGLHLPRSFGEVGSALALRRRQRMMIVGQRVDLCGEVPLIRVPPLLSGDVDALQAVPELLFILEDEGVAKRYTGAPRCIGRHLHARAESR